LEDNFEIEEINNDNIIIKNSYLILLKDYIDIYKKREQRTTIKICRNIEFKTIITTTKILEPLQKKEKSSFVRFKVLNMKDKLK
jgi:hypothetical protein